MTTKATNSQVAILKTLGSILKRLDALEKATASVKPAPKATMTVPEAVLREKLGRLTLKRHAVLTATLGGVSYQDIASFMGCEATTVKLHLRGALITLGIGNRSLLLAVYPDLLDPIPDREYEQRYGIGKKWWLERKPALMTVLRTAKPAKNQYTK